MAKSKSCCCACSEMTIFILSLINLIILVMTGIAGIQKGYLYDSIYDIDDRNLDLHRTEDIIHLIRVVAEFITAISLALLIFGILLQIKPLTIPFFFLYLTDIGSRAAQFLYMNKTSQDGDSSDFLGLGMVLYLFIILYNIFFYTYTTIFLCNFFNLYKNDREEEGFRKLEEVKIISGKEDNEQKEVIKITTQKVTVTESNSESIKQNKVENI